MLLARVIAIASVLSLLGVDGLNAQPRAGGPPAAAAPPAAALAATAVPTESESTGIRDVTASGHSLIPLETKLRFTTLVLLPDNEEILDVICGDQEFWVISATENIAHIKPAKAGAETNLNLVTASGTVYSFLLREGQALGKPTATPDLKVYVRPDPSIQTARRRYYRAAEYEAIQSELAEVRASIAGERRRVEEQIAAFKSQFPAAMRFDYTPVKNERPFHVRAIWHDGEFTYIQSDARELPVLYEVADGNPAVVNFQVREGTHVVPKVLERAYLALGEQRLPFEQRR